MPEGLSNCVHTGRVKLFWCPQTRAMRTVWLLEEAGLPYERVHIDVRDEAAKADPDFRRASPMGKVPALSDGEARLADSTAIALYIADRYPAAKLAPPSYHVDRAQYAFWMVYSSGYIEPAMVEKFSGTATNRGTHGWGDFDSMIGTLERGVEPGPWLLQERFTAADILVGTSVHFLKVFKVLPASTALEAYLARCNARPAFQRALAIDRGE